MIKTYLRAAVAGGLLIASGLAHAQLSSTLTATSDYDFRGFSQSAKKPAVQASIDYALPGGFAVGAWASNVDFAPADGDIEVDLYASYTGALGETSGWTAGLTYYAYPDSEDLGEYAELYVGLNLGALGLKQWYSRDFYDLGDSAFYTEANATYPLPANFSLLLHAGYSWGEYWSNAGGSVLDVSAGVGYTLGRFGLALRFTGTDASGEGKYEDDVSNNEARVMFSVATTF